MATIKQSSPYEAILISNNPADDEQTVVTTTGIYGNYYYKKHVTMTIILVRAIIVATFLTHLNCDADWNIVTNSFVSSNPEDYNDVNVTTIMYHAVNNMNTHTHSEISLWNRLIISMNKKIE